MTEPPPLPPRNRLVTLLIGMTVANFVGGVLLFGVTMLSSLYKNRFESAITYPSFFLLPLIVGLVAAWFFRRLNRGLGITFLDALWVSLVGLGAAAIVLREGVICLAEAGSRIVF